MCAHSLSTRGGGTLAGSFTQFKLWQLAVLVAYVAIAIADVQSHGRREPALIALAAAGYIAFGGFCWLAWNVLQRLDRRVPPVLLTACYAFVMALVFLAAVIAYLVIEYVYLGGKLL